MPVSQSERFPLYERHSDETFIVPPQATLAFHLERQGQTTPDSEKERPQQEFSDEDEQEVLELTGRRA